MMWQSQFLTSLSEPLLLTKRNVVLVWVLLLAALFFANGIYILGSGRIGPRLTKLAQPNKSLPYPSRLALAALYLAVATGLALLVWKFRHDVI